MPITLNETVLQNCDTNPSSNWQNDTNNTGTAGNIAGGSVPPQEGTNCVEFDNGANATFGVRMVNTVTPFSVRSNEVGIWFLNPKFGEAGAGSPELLAQTDSAVRLRLYSGANAVDYYQKQWRLGNGLWQGGWLYLRASGAAGSEDAIVTGSWSNTQADAVDRIGVTVESVAANTSKNALEYQIDYAKFYDKIIVTGFANPPTNTIPWTPADIYAQDLADNGANPEIWGVVNNVENFFKFFCGLEIGDGTTVTEFEASNEFLFFDHSSAAHKYNITIKNNATVTLGVKNAKTVETYAQDGVQIVATENGFFTLTTPSKCAPSFTVESGGVLRIYAGLLQGFGTVNLGSGGAGEIEKLFSDFYDNDIIEFRSTDMTVDACRYHTESGDKQDLGIFYSVPTSLNRITVFNCIDGLVFRISYNGSNFVRFYRALGGTTYDVGILEANTLDLVDSTFDPDKILRVT